jgi:hypothetical protein
LDKGLDKSLDKSLDKDLEKKMALRYSVWIRCFSTQDRIGFYEDITKISTKNNEEPKKLTLLKIRHSPG